MDDVKRYSLYSSHVAGGTTFIESTEQLRKDFPQAVVYVRAEDYDALLNKYQSMTKLLDIDTAQILADSEEIDRLKDQLDALREELAKSQERSVTNIMMDVVPGLDGMGDEIYAKSVAEVQLLISNLYLKTEELEESLTAAEQRNAACNAEIVAMIESALRRSFSLGQVYWQQADSDSICQQNKSDQTMEVQAQHILNVVKSINALTKPTESGASNKCVSDGGTCGPGGQCAGCPHKESGASE